MNLANTPARQGQASAEGGVEALRLQLRSAEAELSSLQDRKRDLLAMADEKARAAQATDHLKSKNLYRRTARRFTVLANFPAKRIRELSVRVEAMRAQLANEREQVAA